jgi:iron complex outermembrane recepter protein
MFFHKKILTVSILAAISPFTFAQEDKKSKQLETLKSTAHPLTQTAADYAAADTLLGKNQLMSGAPTIGDALENEVGIYSNQYGAGSSRPVIRGQDGPRVKVLQHASETADVSTLSPDHAITIDPILAKQVEVIRGPSTLLYAAGTVGGLVNVTDSKIPTKMPDKGYEGNVNVRYGTGSDEKIVSGGVTAALGDQFALRVEGLKRDANDYIAPNYYHDHDSKLEKERRVGNTFAKGETFNIGGSWILDRGFVGLSYSNRQDQYGLPGHSHEYESCHPHDDHLHCDGNNHAGHNTPGHDHSGSNHDHDEHEAGPWVDLKTERYDLRTELADPFAGFSKLRAHASYTDYKHDEIEGSEIATTFKSKGYDGRLELVHNPIAGWEGVVGTQYNQQKLDITGEESILAPTKTQKWSLFALEHKQINDFHIELGARVDHQTIDIDSNQKNYNDQAYSGSAAVNWNFAPNYTLSLVGSHQQRLPLAQELYADGKHLATNTYERGNANLDVEKSNNLEVGFHFDNGVFDYHVHAYQNWFDNYIYAATTDKFENFRLVDYTQDKARFYGLEAEAGYAINDVYKLSVFGDAVRGKIDGKNAPRVPAGRLGTKVDVDFGDGWSGSAEYSHVFKQDRIAAFEQDTSGYNMVNLGVSYAGKYAQDTDYRVYFKANNLLDEDVYQHASFLSNIPQVGRNFTIGLEFGF